MSKLRKPVSNNAGGRAWPPTPLTVTRDELLRDGCDAAFRGLVHRLLAFSSRLEGIRQDFASSIGLSGIQYTILISISHLQGVDGVGNNAIAAHLSLSNAFVTVETGKLIRLELVSKRTNPDDRRRVQLVVTAKGLALLGDLAEFQQNVNDVLFASLTESDFDKLLELTNGLLDGAERAAMLSRYQSDMGIGVK